MKDKFVQLYEEVVDMNLKDSEDKLRRLDRGQQVRISGGGVEVYAGLEWIQVCSCPCTPNTFQFSVTVWEEEGKIIRREIRDRVHMWGPVDPSNDHYKNYQSLIRGSA